MTEPEDWIERLQGVTDAAMAFVHAEQMAAVGPYEPQRKKALKNLHEEVAAFEEWVQEL